MIEIYTDGACSGNPGKGGLGIILKYQSKIKEFSQGFRLTTNNRMELWAVILGLEKITKKYIPIIIYSDSKYVVDAITKKWLDNWIKTDFKGGIKNKDLWTRYYHLSTQFQSIQLLWIKGHADNPHNNRCDRLAVNAYNSNSIGIDEVYETNYTRKI